MTIDPRTNPEVSPSAAAPLSILADHPADPSEYLPTMPTDTNTLYDHLTDDQKAKIREVAISVTVEDALQDSDFLRLICENYIDVDDICACLDTITDPDSPDCVEIITERLGFNPDAV